MENVGREPCFWSMTPSSNPGYNLVDRERFIVVNDEQGNPIQRKEKFPQRGHLGDYEDRQAAPGQRFATVVRHDGNVAHVPLTNAAAHLDPNTPYGQYMRQKGFFLGWFGLESCPAALIQAGQLRPSTIVDKSILTAAPCPRNSYSADNVCPHCVAETKARQAVQRAKNDAQADAHKNSSDRQAEAAASQSTSMVQMLEEQRKQFALMQEQSNAQIAALTALLAQNGIAAEGKKK